MIKVESKLKEHKKKIVHNLRINIYNIFEYWFSNVLNHYLLTITTISYTVVKCQSS